MLYTNIKVKKSCFTPLISNISTCESSSNGLLHILPGFQAKSPKQVRSTFSDQGGRRRKEHGDGLAPGQGEHCSSDLGFPRFFMGFPRFFMGFLRFFMGFPRFFMGFLRFFMGFPRFFMGFLRFFMSQGSSFLGFLRLSQAHWSLKI